MGQTRTQRHQKMYCAFINEGMTHEEAIDSFPEYIQKQVLKDIYKDAIESHFGMKPLWFFLSLITTIIGVVIFGIHH